VRGGAVLQVAVDTAHGELESAKTKMSQSCSPNLNSEPIARLPSYNASVLEIYNATSSPLHLDIFLPLTALD
jgi:hypothetical protein